MKKFKQSGIIEKDKEGGERRKAKKKKKSQEGEAQNVGLGCEGEDKTGLCN